MTTSSSPVAVLRKSKRASVLSLCAKRVLLCLTGNASFPSPDPGLDELEEAIAELDDAIEAALNKEPGTCKDRDAKRVKLGHLLDHLRDHVQRVVETQAVYAVAAAMIESAGMFVKKVGRRHKAALAANQGAVSGEVALVAKAVARLAMYYWELSLDQVHWTKLPETMQADTVVTGLTPGQMYYFRFRVITRVGPRDYSDVVSLRVT